MPLQDLIHKFEEGEWSKSIKTIVIVMALLVLALIYNLREFRNFTAPEAMDMAQVARNVAEGKGFTTQMVRPLALHLIQEHQGNKVALLKQDFPDISNPPVYPLMLAGLMKMLPFEWEIPKTAQMGRYQPEFWIALFNQIWFIGIILLVFHLARRLFDPSVAWFSATMVACSDLFWKFSMSGLPTLFVVLLVMLITVTLVGIEQRVREGAPGGGWCVGRGLLLGVLLGVGTLTQYGFMWLLIPVILFLALYGGEGRVKMIVLATVVSVLMVAPWLVRNYEICGLPFGVSTYTLSQDTARFAGSSLERTLQPDPTLLSAFALEDVIRKFLLNAPGLLQNDLPKLGGTWLSGFFLVGLLSAFINPSLTRLRRYVLVCLALFGVVQILARTWLTTTNPMVVSENYLFWFAPLVIIFGVGFFHMLVANIEVPFEQARKWITVFVGVILCAPMVFTILPPRSLPVCYPPYYPWLIQKTAGYMQESELVMSDMPWAVAWYGRRQCLWMTMNPRKEFFTINDYYKPIKALYLTHITLDERFLTKLVKGEDRAWGRFILESLLKGNVPAGFPLRNAWADVLPDQIFLSDWERWRTPAKR